MMKVEVWMDFNLLGSELVCQSETAKCQKTFIGLDDMLQ